MKFFRVSTILALTLSAASGFMLFSTAQKVQQADSELQRMRATVAQEEQTIRVLRAEWDYLNRPDRLEALVTNKLDLIPATADSVRNDTAELPETYVPFIPARKPSFTMKAIPAVMDNNPAPAPLPAPVAPQSPQTLPQKDFNKLLNELAPTGGDEE